MARAAMRRSTGSRRRSGRRVVAGPKTNLAFLRALADAPEFRAGRFDTGFIDANLEALGAVEQPLDAEAARLGALMLDRRRMGNPRGAPVEPRAGRGA